MLDRTERFCKWSLLVVLVLDLIAPILLICALDLLHTNYVFDAILFFLLIATVIQGIVGLIGWSMLSRENEKGKSLIKGTYLSTLAGYGLYSLYLQVTLLLPGISYVFPLEVLAIFTLFFNSAAIFLLQHFWTRYIF